MSVVHDALERLLAAHAPFPALVVDRGWDLVSANEPVYALLAGVPSSLLEPPVNVIRLTLHEDVDGVVEARRGRGEKGVHGTILLPTGAGGFEADQEPPPGSSTRR